MSKRVKIQPKTKPGKFCTPPAKEAPKTNPKAPDKNKKQENILEKICSMCFASCQQTKPAAAAAPCKKSPPVVRKKSVSSTIPKKTATSKPNVAALGCGMSQKPSAVSNNADSNKSGQGKCAKEGPLTRNPFLNYLRHFRKTHCGISMVQIAVEGGKSWNAMSDQDKWPYIVEAFRARKRRRSSSHINIGKRKRRHSKGSNKRKSRSCSRASSYIN